MCVWNVWLRPHCNGWERHGGLHKHSVMVSSKREGCSAVALWREGSPQFTDSQNSIESSSFPCERVGERSSRVHGSGGVN